MYTDTNWYIFIRCVYTTICKLCMWHNRYDSPCHFHAQVVFTNLVNVSDLVVIDYSQIRQDIKAFTNAQWIGTELIWWWKICVSGTYSETYELIIGQYGRYLIMVGFLFDVYNRNLIEFILCFALFAIVGMAVTICLWVVGNTIAKENVHDGKKWYLKI